MAPNQKHPLPFPPPPPPQRQPPVPHNSLSPPAPTSHTGRISAYSCSTPPFASDSFREAGQIPEEIDNHGCLFRSGAAGQHSSSSSTPPVNQKRALPGLPRPPTPPSESGSGLERLRSFHNSDRGSSNIFSSTDDSLTKNEVSLAIKSARSVDTRVTVSTIGPDGVPLKKRRTGPGSRGVANLTPEQLAKKRANGIFFLPIDLDWLWHIRLS